MRWGRVAALVALFAAVAAGAALVSWRKAGAEFRESAARQPVRPVLDVSRSTTRHALNLQREVKDMLWATSLWESCDDGSEETYRLSFVPGRGPWRGAEFRKSAGGSALLARSLREQGASDPARNVFPVVDDEFKQLRAAATDLLVSDTPTVSDSWPTDTTHTLIEMCREGRYYFYHRIDPQRDKAADAPFMRLADRMEKQAHIDRLR